MAKNARNPEIETLPYLGEWQLGRTIGVGNYGVVRLCRQLNLGARGEKFAMKVMPKSVFINKPSLCARLDKEWCALSEFDHPNILQGVEIVQDPNHIGLVTEFLEGGDLLSLIRKKKFIPEVESRRLFLQILSAVTYAHERGVVHRDLKAENVFLSAQGDACVGDWGFCTSWRSDQKLREHFGSVHYAAPELFLGRGYVGPEIDMWSLGVLLFAMTTGNFPFFSNDPKELGRQIVSGGPLNFPPHLSQSHSLRHLIQSLLDVNPKTRFSSREVLSHPWIRKALINFESLGLPSNSIACNFFPPQHQPSSMFSSRLNKNEDSYSNLSHASHRSHMSISTAEPLHALN